MAHAAQPVSLAHAHNSTRLRDSVRQATSQVQRRSRDVGGSPERPCLARGDCCPPGKGCNRAGPSSRDEAGVLQPLLHRTQERWWPSANPGSASLEPGFTQAPVQDADAQAHDQMHSAPGLVCSDRPEGRLLSRFDPSATQTVSTVCVRRSGMAVQGPPLRALPVSPCGTQGSHHALLRSGGEPASTALGGGRSSLSVAVSRKSIAHIRDPHPERQKLRAALCLPRRAAEREGCLQTEAGPLDSGGRRLSVPIARRAMPPGGEGSLHQECCLLPCVGARCLFGRHLQSCGLGDTEHLR